MYLSIPLIVLLVGLGMIFILNRKVSGIITSAVALVLMGVVHIPMLSPAVQFVKDLF